MKYILNYGGGVNSTALYFVLRQKGFPLDEIIFADTGSELPETYQTVEQFRKLVEKDGVLFTTVRSGLASSLYEYCWKKRMVPSRMKRDCTSKFKVSPIRKYMREKYGKQETFTQYIGISLEEGHRMRASDVRYASNSYPLVDERIDRNGCEAILKQNGFEKVEKSGCFFCPFTRAKNWELLLYKHKDLFQKAIDLEENRSNEKTLLSSKPLRVLLDSRKGQKSLHDFQPTCDVSGSCFL